MSKKNDPKESQDILSIEEEKPESIVNLWWHQDSTHSVEINVDFRSICFNFDMITPEQAIKFIKDNYLKNKTEEE